MAGLLGVSEPMGNHGTILGLGAAGYLRCYRPIARIVQSTSLDASHRARLFPSGECDQYASVPKILRTVLLDIDGLGHLAHETRAEILVGGTHLADGGMGCHFVEEICSLTPSIRARFRLHLNRLGDRNVLGNRHAGFEGRSSPSAGPRLGRLPNGFL